MTTNKKKARELSPEEMVEKGVKWGEELHHDLHASTIALSPEDQEVVDKARDSLLELLDVFTSSVPAEPSVDHLEYAFDMCKHAVYFRNVIRRCFLQAAGHEMPEKWERIEGSVH